MVVKANQNLLLCLLLKWNISAGLNSSCELWFPCSPCLPNRQLWDPTASPGVWLPMLRYKGAKPTAHSLYPTAACSNFPLDDGPQIACSSSLGNPDPHDRAAHTVNLCATPVLHPSLIPPARLIVRHWEKGLHFRHHTAEPRHCVNLQTERKITRSSTAYLNLHHWQWQLYSILFCYWVIRMGWETGGRAALSISKAVGTWILWGATVQLPLHYYWDLHCCHEANSACQEASFSHSDH